MSDLLSVLPDFPFTPQTHDIIISLEKQNISTADLLTLEQLDISKRATISLLDLRRFIKEVANALHTSIGSTYDTKDEVVAATAVGNAREPLGFTGLEVWKYQLYMSTGDSVLDGVLNGGIMSGGITEIVGERYGQLVIFTINIY